jgi:hypothetical protein
VWQQLCICPGAEKQRAWKEDPDEPWPGFKEFQEGQQRKSQEREEAQQEAFEAARAAVDGKTRDEVRDLYVAELRARGLDVPPEPLLEVAVDLLTGHHVRALVDMGKGITKFTKLARTLFSPGP